MKFLSMGKSPGLPYRVNSSRKREMARSSNISAQRRSKMRSGVSLSSGSNRYRSSPEPTSNGRIAPPPRFWGACAIRLIGQKKLARVKKKGSESPPAGIGAVQVAAFEDPDEEVLSEVLCLFIQMATPAHISVNGIPIVLA